MANHNASSSLMDSVKSGDLSAVNAALSRSPDLHAKCNRDCIKTAVMNNRKKYHEILGALQEYGLTVNPSDANDAKFFHAAVEKGYLQVVEDLLKYGAKVDVIFRVKGAVYHSRLSALQRAARNNHEEMAELLIKHGANPLIRGGWTKTPMFYFTIGADIKLINMLFASNPNYKSNRHVLHTAVLCDNLEMVQTLLQHGVSVLTRDNVRGTALHSCIKAMGNHDVKVQMAELLLSKGADVNAHCAGKWTPLHLASAQEDPIAIAEVLLRHNANVHAVNKDGETALHIAAENGHKEMCVILIKHGAIINVKTKSGLTPLHMSSCGGHAEIVKMLLEFGAIINHEHEVESSALHEAIRGGHEKVVEYYFKWGANFNAKSFWVNSLGENGRRDWMGNEMIVKMILDQGVDINEKGWNGYTALHCAAKCDSHGALWTLLKLGAKVNVLTDNGSTPLCLAATCHYLLSCETLLAYGAAINLANADHETPLFRAAANQNIDNVYTLLNHGADVNISSKRNEIALVQAIKEIASYMDLNDFGQLMGPDVGYVYLYIVQPLIRQIVKLQMKNMFVSDDNLRAVKEIKELERYRSECEAEVVKMACDQIPNCEITYFDILRKSIGGVASLFNNECILQGLQSKEYKGKYLNYGRNLEWLSYQGLLRKKHNDQGEMLIRILYPEMPQVCIDNILSFLRYEYDDIYPLTIN